MSQKLHLLCSSFHCFFFSWPSSFKQAFEGIILLRIFYFAIDVVGLDLGSHVATEFKSLSDFRL